MGSDHDVYQDSAFGIPSIYLNDWPDRYIHTNFDTAANIDPTKLRRAAFIGAASGYFLANFSLTDISATTRAVEIGKLLRAAAALEKGQDAAALEGYERGIMDSLFKYPSDSKPPPPPPFPAGHATPLFQRRPEPRGPLVVFGYDYFADHAQAAGIPAPRLLSYEGSWGSGEEYAYEALNFADGIRSVRQITAALTTEYGPVPEELVLEYLQALQKIGVLTPR